MFRVCHHYYCVGSGHSHHSKKKYVPISIHSHAPLQPLAATICILSQWTCLFCPFYVSGVTHRAAICVWLLSLSMWFSGFIHVVHVLDFLSFCAPSCGAGISAQMTVICAGISAQMTVMHIWCWPLPAHACSSSPSVCRGWPPVSCC